MKKVSAFLRSSISSSKNDLKRVEIELRELRKRVIYINGNPVKVRAMVEVVKYLSRLEDKNVFDGTIVSLEKKNYGQLDDVLIAFYELKSYLGSARRGRFGHNRAKPGERVSASNVYLGGVSGLDMKPASYWLKNRKELETVFKKNVGTAGNQPVSKWWLVNNSLADDYVKKTVNGIKKNIDIIIELI